MGAAIALRDVVGEAQHVLVVAVVPPQRGFDVDAVALGPHMSGCRMSGDLGAVEIAHEGLEAALVHQLLAPHLGMARIGEDDAHARIEEGELAQPVLQRGVVELHHGEGLRGGQEASLPCRARPSDGPTTTQRRIGIAVGEAHRVLLAVAPDAQAQPLDESALTTETPTPCRPPETL